MLSKTVPTLERRRNCMGIPMILEGAKLLGIHEKESLIKLAYTLMGTKQLTEEEREYVINFLERLEGHAK